MKGPKTLTGVLGKNSYASTIMHPYNPQEPFYFKLYNKIMTNFHASQIRHHFLDFDRAHFPELSISIYNKTYKAFHDKDKPELLQLVTLPNYELLKLAMKNNVDLPFIFHPLALKAKLVQANIISERGDNVENSTFAHITMEMICKSKEGSEVTQYNVFERRMDVKKKEAWRLALIE